MRLSAWTAIAPHPAALSSEVRAVIGPVLDAIGGDADPHCLPLWGGNPDDRYTLFSLSPTGLVVSAVRVEVPGEGPRITARLVRWSRLQMGELSIETSRGHRVLTMTLENQVLRAADEEADRIAWFVRAAQATEMGRSIDGGVAGAGGSHGVAARDETAIRALPAPQGTDGAGDRG